ncbi:MAG: DUF4265 domain-containing protein [Bergeyella zoohelcum]|nr:DUF4265 domain-containing protein [Bergeyella zoohelcum]
MKTKIILVYKDLEGNIAEESIWAEKLENGYYRVDNIPFYAPNLAYNDIIDTEEDNGILYFDGLVESSRHSTIQIVFFQETEIEKVLFELENLGCKWEGMNNQLYYSVDVSPEINYLTIKQILDKHYAKGILDYKEACLS